MGEEHDGAIGEARIVGMGVSEEVPDFLQNIFGSAGLNKREKNELIKTYLGVKNLGDTARTYKRFPYTFNKAMSKALEDLSKRAKNIKKTSEPEGAPINYSLDDEGSTFEDALFGGEFDLNGDTIRAVIESVSPHQQGVMMIGAGICPTGGSYTIFSVYTRKEDRVHASSIFEIVDDYMGEKNPLKGKIIDINGEEEDFGDYDWEDLAIPDYFRTEVEENIILPVKYHDKFRAANLRIPRGLMLEGERGMGKTLLSRIISNKLKGSGTFIRAKPSDIQRMGWEYVFEIARALEPSVLYIEDIETLTPAKQRFDGMFSSVGEASLTDALDYIDGTEERSNVMILASTNVPELVELGVIDRPGRIDRRLVFDPNNAKDFGTEWKEEVFRIHLRGHKLEDGLDVSKLASMIGERPYTGSHIEELIHTATLEALRSFNIEEKSVDEIKDTALSEDDFRRAKERVERIVRRTFGNPEVS
ncbi:MAG: ATP-binding protein [Halobacteriota archaeon]|nr:ATP-binding protein [Halobacteriota archaeon]